MRQAEDEDEGPAPVRPAVFAQEAPRKKAQGEDLAGMFPDAAAQRAFCGELAEMLRTGEDVETALAAAKVALCERNDAIVPLCEDPEVLAVYCALAKDRLGSTVAHDALKCLNNALYEHPRAQAVFRDLPLDRGVRLLAKVLEQTGDLEALRLAGSVGMMLVAARNTVAGTADEADAEGTVTMCDALAEAAMKGAVALAAQMSKGASALNLFAGEDDGAAARATLVASCKVVYAVMVVAPKALATRAAAARESRGDIDAEGLAQFLDNLQLEADAPIVDKYGLMIVEILAPLREALGEDGDAAGAKKARQSLNELRLQAASIAMLACDFEGFPALFVRRGALAGLLDILDATTREIADEVTDPIRAVQSVGELLPFIITCTRVVQASPQGRDEAHTRVFPRSLPPLAQDDGESDADFEARQKARQMAGNTPKDTLGGRLIPFLTCLNSNLKRCVGELLFEICGQSPNEMTSRCGYGNAAHMIAIKAGMMGQILQKQEEDRARRNDAQK